MYQDLVKRMALVLTVMSCLIWLAGCGGGGGGSSPSSSVPSVPQPTIPDVSSTSGTTTSTSPTPSTTTSPTPTASASPGGTTVSGSTQAALDPSGPPSVPTSPPPALSKSAASSASASSTTIGLIKGWNAISFPFSQLQSASGFTHQIYGYSLGTFTAYDPVHNPTTIDTRFAYLAYADSNTQVTVSGTTNAGDVNTVPLVQGWNLIGCPSTNNLLWSNMSATRLGVTRVLEETATASQSPDASWFSRYVFGLLASVSVGEDIRVSGDALLSTQGRWVFAWQDTTLNLNVVPPSPPPSITSTSLSTLSAGAALTISGSGFSTSDMGTVTIGGVQLQPTDITSWTDTTIKLVVPVGTASGSVIVFVNRFPSNRVAETTSNPGSGSSVAALSGQVQDNTGKALAGAQILVDSGQQATSDANGAFIVNNIPPGQHLVIASHIGNNVGSGVFTFSAGVTKTVLVTLSPLSSSGGGGGGGGGGSTNGDRTGTLYASAYPFSSGGTRYYVSKILVNEYGNYSNRWQNQWFEDTGSSSQSLTCNGAIIGRQYVIRITWANVNNSSDTRSNTWYATLYSSGQTETHYNP